MGLKSFNSSSHRLKSRKVSGLVISITSTELSELQLSLDTDVTIF